MPRCTGRFFDGRRGTACRRKSFLRPTVLRRVSCVCGRCGAAKRALYPRCRLRRKYAPHLCVCCMRHKRRNGFLAAFGLGGCARIFGAALLFPSRCFRAKNANWKAQSQHAALYIQTGRRFCFALSGGRVCRAEAAGCKSRRRGSVKYTCGTPKAACFTQKSGLGTDSRPISGRPCRHDLLRFTFVAAIWAAEWRQR